MSDTPRRSSDYGRKEYAFSFHPGTAGAERITWKRMAADAYEAHRLATAAAVRDHPMAHGFLTVAPQGVES